ncbi:hypothetical protein OGAPHI_006539 [Ogataea philodendri]|uniref:Uncharacterized protein n=1 Tax=Ogataea philodendri TaxID=1378263 RepID=A0A9P8NYB5_9ASCO|nr:uncharacterized protein OGAPHI_006539 [Ogataea philodendri]KAH3661689.1 hypothetical protein OGAPHI_006539 [Ogataea philodendri]
MTRPLVFLALVLLLPLVYQHAVGYLNAWRVPLSTLRHYVEHPLDDVVIKIPIYYESNDLKLLDVAEAVSIQIAGRLREHEAVVPDVQFEVREWNNETDGLVVKLVLGDGNGIYVDPIEGYAVLFYNLETVDANDVPYFATQLIVDHCYNDELRDYAIDSFVQLIDNRTGKHTFLHSSQYEPKRSDHVTFVLVMMSPDLRWEAEQAANEYMRPFLDNISNYTLEFVTVNESSVQDHHFVDERFPEELSSLPNLADFYESHTNTSSTVYLVYYPFELAEQKIQKMTVDGHGVYSTHENTFLSIKTWGSIYFAHTSLFNTTVPAPELQDCMWCFSETVLDTFEFPNDNMTPLLRNQMFQRTTAMKNLVLFAYSLAKVVTHIESHRLETDLASAILDAFALRQQVKAALESKQYSLALELSRRLLSLIEHQTQNL